MADLDPATLRTLDTLHLASCVYLADLGQGVEFASYDRRMNDNVPTTQVAVVEETSRTPRDLMLEGIKHEKIACGYKRFGALGIDSDVVTSFSEVSM